MATLQTLTLTEFQPLHLPQAALSTADGTRLWRDYGQQVAVEFPSPKTADHWLLTAQGWVGHIPLTPQLHLHLQPKIPLHNLFRMLEYAYDLRPILPADVVRVATLPEFYTRLAALLAQRILARARLGLFHSYEQRHERTAAVRGRIDLQAALRHPAQVGLTCDYAEHTADIPHNQILAWTLHTIIATGLCTGEPLRLTQGALRHLPVLLRPFTPSDLDTLVYSRLNEDYRPLHTLCRFFLDYSGPTHATGEQNTLPFLVNMDLLFEKFVAAWLSHHLPRPYTLKVQPHLAAGETAALNVRPDLVIYTAEGAPLAVLDTKYKATARPTADDVYQIAFYASNVLGCPQAVLVYPQPLASPLNDRFAQTSVRTLAFPLGGDVDEAGAQFVAALALP